MDSLAPISPAKVKIPPMLPKKPRKIAIKPPTQCATPHENHSQPQIPRGRPQARNTPDNSETRPGPSNTPRTQPARGKTRTRKTLNMVTSYAVRVLRSTLKNLNMLFLMFSPLFLIEIIMSGRFSIEVKY